MGDVYSELQMTRVLSGNMLQLWNDTNGWTDFVLFDKNFTITVDKLADDGAFILGRGENNVAGSATADTLEGTDLDDFVLGLAGNDRFGSSAGVDVYVGGAGSDTVVFANDPAQFASGADIFADWTPIDRLDFQWLQPILEAASGGAMLYSELVNAGFQVETTRQGTMLQLIYDGNVTDVLLFENIYDLSLDQLITNHAFIL
jgi:Ca2+-binding RTX toxin-like protein